MRKETKMLISSRAILTQNGRKLIILRNLCHVQAQWYSHLRTRIQEYSRNRPANPSIRKADINHRN